MTDIIPIGKFDKRIEQVVNHLVGTELPLSNAMTPTERNDVEFTRQVLSKIFIHPLTNKWMRKYVTTKL